MKKMVWLLLLLYVGLGAMAQRKLYVQGNFPDIYTTHRVSPKENLAIVSDLYNLTMGQLANANGIAENSYINVGKELKIPLTPKNFTQNGQKDDKEILIPIYHTVQRGENLFRIAQNYGRLRMDFIREWNDLNTETIQPEQNIVIGHLRVLRNNQSQVLTEPKAVSTTETNNDSYAGNGQPTPTRDSASNKTTNAAPDDEGFFVTQYPSKPNGKNLYKKNGDAAAFKSTSGWSDRKYYVLMNNVTPGTIVRITASNNKSICAKVLGALPEMKENNGLLLRMSNAAVSALGISDGKFAVSISYYQSLY